LPKVEFVDDSTTMSSVYAPRARAVEVGNDSVMFVELPCVIATEQLQRVTELSHVSIPFTFTTSRYGVVAAVVLMT
jgi:hypothetical protein